MKRLVIVEVNRQRRRYFVQQSWYDPSACTLPSTPIHFLPYFINPAGHVGTSTIFNLQRSRKYNSSKNRIFNLFLQELPTMGSSNIAVFCALVTLICFTQLKAENNEVEAQDESSKKHILVFGGNGFIGGSTVIKLLQRGYTVHTVNRFEF